MAQGHSFEAAFELVRASTVFTAHAGTAGHDVFDFGLIDKYFLGY